MVIVPFSDLVFENEVYKFHISNISSIFETKQKKWLLKTFNC